MSLSHNDVHLILKLIDDAEHLEEIDLTWGGFRLHVRRHGTEAGGPAPDPVQVPATAQRAATVASTPPALSELAFSAPAKGKDEEIPQGTVLIQAPMLGTFYRAPAPGEPPFIEVGQTVRADQTLCLIEVMKLFNSVKAGVNGTIVRICAQDASLVEYGQTLILVEPSAQ